MGGNVWGGNILGGASGIPAKGDSVVIVSLEEIIEGKYSLVYAHPEASEHIIWNSNIECI
ncbi:hypothetical protein DPMN_117015 [Dreissena polymorpha]|uniref:Uncharacterized protein n=1 Tax=Dreissena polymorpha TaxID=45954 RepID=A0A9D4QTX4_DREPO|nr:hypothetical protein DPMN_117015 [Dreissena polymorpha]